MPAIAATICSPGRSGTGMPKLAAWNSTAPARNVVAADLMPIGTGVVLPQLAGIEPELQWVSSNDRSLVTLAKSLVELGIADPEDWSRCDKNPSKYVRETTRRWIEKRGAGQVRRRFDLHLTITETILAYPDRAAQEHGLFLIVDPDSAGYVVLKPSMELIESLNKRLPYMRCSSVLEGQPAPPIPLDELSKCVHQGHVEYEVLSGPKNE